MNNKCPCGRNHGDRFSDHHNWRERLLKPILFKNFCKYCYGWGGYWIKDKKEHALLERMTLCKFCFGVAISPIPLTEFYNE